MTDIASALIAAFLTLLAYHVGIKQGYRRGRREGLAHARQIMGAAVQGYRIREREEKP